MSSVIYIPKQGINDPIFYSKYGLLYNWFAINDARNITSEGWRVSGWSDYRTLCFYVDPATVEYNNNSAGGSLKEPGLIHWSSPNTSASNSAGFNAKGSGERSEGGSFNELNAACNLWNVESLDSASAYASELKSISSNFLTKITSITLADNKKYGKSIRLIKESTTLSHGQSGTYTGNDGKVYRTICIGTQEWLADNLAETRYRNGDVIPWHGADPVSYFTNAEWIALTTPGCCAHSNDVNNVGPGFTFPIA